MQRTVRVLFVIAFILSTMPANLAYAGWKENYREKYSKKKLDPNSEKAKRIRRLCNPDIKIVKWSKKPKKKRMASLSGGIMPSRRKGEATDKFEGFSSNFSFVKKGLPKKEEAEKKSGYTLSGCIKELGKQINIKETEESDVK